MAQVITRGRKVAQKRNKQAKTKDMARPIIKSFGSVNRLYKKGVNICKGCERENYGSCTIAHLGICDEQATRHIQAIKRATTYNN